MFLTPCCLLLWLLWTMWSIGYLLWNELSPFKMILVSTILKRCYPHRGISFGKWTCACVFLTIAAENGEKDNAI